jgi:hypothetical protein
MKTRVQIIATEKKVSEQYKSTSYICQCVVFGEKTEVGVCRIGDALAKPLLTHDDQLPPGMYELEYGLAVDWKDRTLKGVLKSITPVSGAAGSPVGRGAEKAAA